MEFSKALMGFRTFIGGIFGMSCLTFGMWMVDLTNRSDAFMAFSVGIVGIMSAIAGKSAVAYLADGSGIQGAKAALMTNKKPGEPIAPPVAPPAVPPVPTVNG